MAESLARLPTFSHIRLMANRPCKPYAHLKGIWQTLLSGTRFPVSSLAENSGAATGESDSLCSLKTSSH